jgi:hypothetical protein
MDLSKLPRLSKTDSPPPADSDASAVEAPTAPRGGFEVVQTTSAPATGYCACGAPLRAGARFCDSCGAPVQGAAAAAAPYAPIPVAPDAGVGAEVWVSAIVGLVLMLIGRSFASWVIAKATGQPFHTGVTWQTDERMGQEVGYWELTGYTALGDCSIFLFGLAMVMEALVLALVHTRIRAKAAIVWAGLLVTVVAILLNLLAAAKLFGVQIMPLWQLLAIGFGGYIAIFEWRMLEQLRGRRRA